MTSPIHPQTGLQDKFDNYFIGYHEPEYYHIEVTSPNYKITVFAPGKQTYRRFHHGVASPDELVQDRAEPEISAMGSAFRRSGDQYYAFTISPRTKKWYILKSSPNGAGRS